MVPLRAVFLMTLSLMAQSPERSAAAVAAAERAFAARAAQEGTRAAFLATLTPEAVVFSPQAENGHAAQRAKPEDGSALRWEPEHVVLAASGDFALSTGPWTWTPKGGTAPVSQGHFLSLWVLQAGTWRVVLDVGAPHPAGPSKPLELVTLNLPVDPAAGRALAVAWAHFDAAAARGLGGALAHHRTQAIRVYRPARIPEPGTFDVDEGPAVRWEPSGERVASSADLAIRWGRRVGPSGSASAVQVWRWEPEGWKVAMDVALPLPPPKP